MCQRDQFSMIRFNHFSDDDGGDDDDDGGGDDANVV